MQFDPYFDDLVEEEEYRYGYKCGQSEATQKNAFIPNDCSSLLLKLSSMEPGTEALKLAHAIGEIAGKPEADTERVFEQLRFAALIAGLTDCRSMLLLSSMFFCGAESMALENAAWLTLRHLVAIEEGKGQKCASMT